MNMAALVAPAAGLVPAALAALGLGLVWLALWGARHLNGASPGTGRRPFEAP